MALKILVVTMLVWQFGCQKEIKKKSLNEAGSAPTETVTITGALVLASDVQEEGLVASQAMVGAKVFLKEQPETVAETDHVGAFTLSLQVSAASAALASGKFHAVMWHTSERPDDTAAARYGAAEEFALNEQSTMDIGTIPLTYTMALHVTIKDADTGDGLAGCTFSFKGYGTHLIAIEKGNGKYDIDYLPAGVLDFSPICAGYEWASQQFEVLPATALDAWQTIPEILLEREPPRR